MEENKDIVIDGQQEALLFQDACTIIEQAQAAAYRQVNETLIKRNWLLGLRINKDVLKAQRAEYGEQIVKKMAKALTNRYGEGFTKTNLYNYVGFYKTWPEIFHAVSGKSDESIESYIFHALSGKSEDIMNALCAKSPIRLSWTHYRIILQENSKEARDWYEREAAREREDLRREIEQQKEFYRLQHKEDNKIIGT